MNPPKDFVGRQKELKTALQILESKKNIIVEGPFGIGKTTFAKKVAAEFEEIAVYCSFEDNALKIIDGLNRQIIKFYRPEGARLGTQVQKFLKAVEGKRLLFIIDDVWKVTLQKVRFFKRLNENQNCQFILISEIRDKNALLLVKSIAWDNHTLKLGRLSRRESTTLFESKLRCSTSSALQRSLNGIISSCRGYPLGLVEAAALLKSSLT